LFERGISARKFKETEVEFDADEHIRAAEGIPTHNGDNTIPMEF
jgi:hypothetical protein